MTVRSERDVWGLNDGLIPRTARKEHRCRGYGRPPYEHTSDCTIVISPGERYVEFVGGTAAYQSGIRLSVPCAIADWGLIEGVNT